MTISGKLSSLYITLDLAQFGLFMSMLGENLGEQFEQFERPSSVLVDPLQEVSTPPKDRSYLFLYTVVTGSQCYFAI